MSIEQDIKDAIAKNLPQAIGEALQQRLKKADEDAAKVIRLESSLTQATQISTELSTKIAGLDAELKKHGDLSLREAAVGKREHDADLQELRFKLEAAQSNQQFARDVAMGLVRNIEYRSTVFESQDGRAVAVPGGGSACGYLGTAGNETKSSTNTNTAA